MKQENKKTKHTSNISNGMKTLKPFLWSYDINQMDFNRDKKRIITNVLNYGTKQATDLIFKIYNKNTLKDMVENPMPGEWNKKSLNYWRLVFDVKNTKELKRNVL